MCAHFLYCILLSLGGNVNTGRMSQPDMGSIFHMKNKWNILVVGNYYVNYQNYQNVMLLSSTDTKRTLMHLFLLQIQPWENWFQYVRRVYATAINFPCILTLSHTKDETTVRILVNLVPDILGPLHSLQPAVTFQGNILTDYMCRWLRCRVNNSGLYMFTSGVSEIKCLLGILFLYESFTCKIIEN